MATNVYRYSPAKTRTYWSYSTSIAGSDDWYGDSRGSAYNDVWESDTVLTQGSFKLSWTYENSNGDPLNVYTGNAYGTMLFGTGMGTPTELAGANIVSARIYLTRYGSGGSSPDSVKIWGCTLTDIPGSGAHSPNGNYSGPSQIIGSLALGQGAWFNLDLDLVQYVIQGKCIVVCYGGSNYMKLYGIENASNKPILEITTTIPTPTLTSPTLGANDDVKDSPHAFSWGASSDQGQFFSPSQLYYEMQFAPDGTTWGVTQTSAQGNPSSALDIKSVLGLQPSQYYYNTAAKIRVRAKTPVWTDGNVYYSTPSATDWTGAAESSAFIIDYSIMPSAPASLTIKRDGTMITSAYEGETADHISITVGRPDTLNAQNHLGMSMGMHYFVSYGDNSAIADGSADTSHASISLSYTIPQLTTGPNDLPVSILAKCVDSEGQISSNYSSTFTINRFGPPTIMITGISRTPTQALVSLKVPDTGYGGTQLITQIKLVNYTTDGTNFVSKSLDSSAWAGSSGCFTNSLTLNVPSTTAYPLFGVQAVNNKPTGTGLSEKTSAICSQAIHENVPAFLAWKDSNPGTHAPSGLATQALIVGASYTTPVDAGYIMADNGMKVGGNTVWHAGNSPKSGNASLIVTATTAGAAGNLMKWDNNGNATDAGIITSGNGSKVVTAIAASTTGNLVSWDFNGNVADSGMSISGWMACNEIWTYSSSITFTIIGNFSNKYQKGDKIIWIQNGSTRYSNIVNVSYSAVTGLTTITKHAGYMLTVGDCDILNTVSYTITNNAFSKWSAPQGFPDWFSWSPIFSCGGSMTIYSVTLHYALFKIENSMAFVACSITCTLGGSPNNTIYASSPVTIDASMSGYTAITCRYLNSGTSVAGTGYVKIDCGTYIRRTDSSNWITGSGNEIEFNTFYRF